MLRLEDAATFLGISRTTAYELAATGRFPVRLFRVGKSYRVPTAALRRLLELDGPPLPPSGEL